jgi:hypothetical protein
VEVCLLISLSLSLSLSLSVLLCLTANELSHAVLAHGIQGLEFVYRQKIYIQDQAVKYY